MHSLGRLVSSDARHSRKPCKIRPGGRRFQGFYLISLTSNFLGIQLQSIDLHIHFVPLHLASQCFLPERRCSRTYRQLVDYRSNRVVGRRATCKRPTLCYMILLHWTRKELSKTAFTILAVIEIEERFNL